MVRKRAYCADCNQLGVEEPNGYCKRFHWEISVKLARADKVCSYDSFKNKFFDGSSELDLVPVKTPLGDISLVSLKDYENGRETKESKLNFWRCLRKESITVNG